MMSRPVRKGRKRQWLFELLRVVPDRMYNHVHFFMNYRRKLNTKHPKHYSDILFAMKMSKPSTLQIQCCNKVGVKEYARSLGLADHIIEPIDVQMNHNDLKWQEYPLPYIVKISNASHLNVDVKTNDDIEWAKKQIRAFSKIDHSIYYREPCYRNSIRNYIVEPRLGDLDKSLADYKVHCFNGKPTYIQINYPDTIENDRVMIDFDNNPVEYPFVSGKSSEIVWDIRKYLPIFYSISEKMSKPFVFVRVDFLIVDGCVYVSEMTFYPSGGLVLRRSDKINRLWGSQIHWKGSDLRDEDRFKK
jgi:hypothetical protein